MVKHIINRIEEPFGLPALQLKVARSVYNLHLRLAGSRQCGLCLFNVTTRQYILAASEWGSTIRTQRASSTEVKANSFWLKLITTHRHPHQQPSQVLIPKIDTFCIWIWILVCLYAWQTTIHIFSIYIHIDKNGNEFQSHIKPVTCAPLSQIFQLSERVPPGRHTLLINTNLRLRSKSWIFNNGKRVRVSAQIMLLPTKVSDKYRNK